MTRAVAIEAVRDYLERQMAAIEPDYQCERSRAEHAPDWPAIWTRRTWLYWLEKKALRRAERAGVGAVLGERLDEALLQTLGLLGEQLHEQQSEWTDASGRRRGGGVVSRELTQDAVTPFWSSPTSISASAEGLRRRRYDSEVLRRLREKRERERAELNRLAQPGNEAERREFARRQSEGVIPFRWRPGQAVRRQEAAPQQAEEPTVSDEAIERRLWALNRLLGGATPMPGYEEVHRQVELAACHFAACRQLQAWDSDEAFHRHLDAREAIDAARAAYPSREVPRDPVRRELAALASLLSRTGPP